MAKAKKATRERQIAPDLEAVDEAAIDAASLKLGFKRGRVKLLSTKVGRLVDHFSKIPPEKLLGPCDYCGGMSSDDFVACPYCGTDDEVVTVDAEPGNKPEAEPVEAELVDAKPVVKPKAELAASTSSVLTTGDLDKSVSSIKEKQDLLVKSAWDLGLALRENYEQELWRLRLTEEGAPAYRNVAQFWAAELSISPPWAYTLIDVVFHFTEKDVHAMGPTRLRVVLSEKDEKLRDKLLTAARGGASASQLAAQRRELRAKKRKKLAASAAKSAGAPPEPDKAERLTVTRVLGRETVQLYKRRKNDKAPLEVAMRIEDLPWADVRVDDNVMVFYRLAQEPTGELVLMVEHRRVSPATEQETG